MSEQRFPEPRSPDAAGPAGAPPPDAGPDDGVAAGGGTAVLEARVAELEERVAELDDRWRRAVADLDNARKRATRDLERAGVEERARVAAAWLPVLDHLDLALGHAAADPASIVAGVESVRDEALDVLARLGFPRRDEVGVPFDPALHEAVATAPDPDAAVGTVVHVVRPGYGTDAHPLRPASVVVATGDAGT